MLSIRILTNLDLGGNIRKLRKMRGLTQDQVVTKMQLCGYEMSRFTYSKLERNVRDIQLVELVILKSIFNVDYNTIFAGIEYVSSADVNESAE